MINRSKNKWKTKLKSAKKRNYDFNSVSGEKVDTLYYPKNIDNEYTEKLSAPLLGLFGDLDQSPTVEQVNQHEDELKSAGKNIEFHRYPEAGHGFFYYDRPIYHQSSAVDGWEKMFNFFAKNLN